MLNVQIKHQLDKTQYFMSSSEAVRNNPGKIV